MKELRFQRLRWNSPWLTLHGPATALGAWILLAQAWRGFFIGNTLLGIGVFVLGMLVCICCLETVHVTAEEIQLRLGPIVLRRIPTATVQSLVRTHVYIGTGESLGESLIILSLYSEEELHKRDKGLHANADDFYNTHLFCGIMPRAEGLWLSYSKERMEQLQAALPGVTEFKRR